MPLADPKVQAAIEELRRRGIQVGESQPAPATPVQAADIQSYGAQPAQPAAPAQPMQVPPPGPADPNVPPHLGGGQYPSQVALERNLRVKQVQGDLAIQDAVNELKRRGINLKLRTASGQEEVIERGTDEALENARKQGDPEAFKNAWRTAFPGRPLPRKPDGSIDYEGGADDLDVENDRKKKLEAAKVGARGIKETKTTRLDPTTGKEQEVLIRYDEVTGNKLSEMILSENRKPVTKEQGDAQKFATIMGQARQTLDQLEAKGFQPESIGATMQRFLPNRFRSDDSQTYESAKDTWIAAHLRDVSGAAISNPEYPRAREQFFPKDGDSPQEVKRKQALRRSVEESVRQIGGQPAPAAAQPGQPAAPAAAPSAAEAPVPVNSASEAPPTAKFIRSPSGRVYRNPKYQGP